MNALLSHTAPAARRRRWVPRRGMTLMEVMVAMVILCGALLGMGRFITSFSHATADGAMSSTASDLVLDRLEFVKASTPYSALPTYIATEAVIPGYSGFTRQTQVLRTNNATTDYTAVTVTVSHPSLKKSVKKTTIIGSF
jgi:prepilin-type N-terminal cleavage/methylation domain-containing protein